MNRLEITKAAKSIAAIDRLEDMTKRTSDNVRMQLGTYGGRDTHSLTCEEEDVVVKALRDFHEKRLVEMGVEE